MEIESASCDVVTLIVSDSDYKVESDTELIETKKKLPEGSVGLHHPVSWLKQLIRFCRNPEDSSPDRDEPTSPDRDEPELKAYNAEDYEYNMFLQIFDPAVEKEYLQNEKIRVILAQHFLLLFTNLSSQI
jgi:hypothetical protein